MLERYHHVFYRRLLDFVLQETSTIPAHARARSKIGVAKALCNLSVRIQHFTET